MLYGITDTKQNCEKEVRGFFLLSWLTKCVFSYQEFGLARFKTSITKTMKGFEFVLAKMQGKLSNAVALIAGTKALFPY